MYFPHPLNLPFLLLPPTLILPFHFLVLAQIYKSFEVIELLGLPVHLQEVQSHAVSLYRCEPAFFVIQGVAVVFLLLGIDFLEG